MNEKNRNEAPFQDRLTSHLLTEFFSMFSSNTRILIISSLVQRWKPESEDYWRGLTVQEIADEIGASVTVVSHNLRYLRQAHVVHSHRVGRNIFYFIYDDCISDLFYLGLNHITEPVNQRNLASLKKTDRNH